MDKLPMTAEGYAALESELKHCQQVERPRIIQQITDARTHGDLSENAEYHAAKESRNRSMRAASPSSRTSSRVPKSLMCQSFPATPSRSARPSP